MNIPSIVIFGKNRAELDSFLKKEGFCLSYADNIDELKERLLTEEVAVLLVEEGAYTALLPRLLLDNSPDTKVIVFGNSQQSENSYKEYIRWPNKDKVFVLEVIKIAILEYLIVKDKKLAIKNTKLLSPSSNFDYAFALELLRSFTRELDTCRDFKSVVSATERYAKEIFQYDLLAVVINSERGLDLYGFCHRSKTRFLKSFFQYIIITYKLLSERELKKEDIAEIYINNKRLSSCSFLFSIAKNPFNSLFETYSYVLFPLVSEKENIGLIGLCRRKEKIFGIDELKIISLMSFQLGHILANIKLISQIKNISIRDALTGLYNRQYFNELLHYEYMRAKRYNLPLSLVMLDIDYFKSINDTFGHLIGDRVLQEIARLIKSSVRKTDIVVRFGGEEFAIILLNTSIRKAVYIAERLRKKIKRNTILIDKNNLNINLTISAGISGIREDISSEKEIVDEADKALLKAKLNGRNRIYVCTGKGIIEEIKTKDKERRKYQRISTNLQVCYTPLVVDKDKFKAKMRDISEEGISFEDYREFPKGSLLLMDFDIPIEDSLKHHVKAVAEVVWNKRVNEKIITGAHLITLNFKDREVIKKFVIRNQNQMKDQ